MPTPSRKPRERNLDPKRDDVRRAAWLCGLDDLKLAAALDADAGSVAPSLIRQMRSLLVCPRCHGDLGWFETIRCLSCRTVYGLIEGIPVLRSPASTSVDLHKDQQARFSDDASPEFEITRPHGTTRLYRWLLAEKFYRSVACLPAVEECSAVTLCGGSGMDAEFLTRIGASVISFDISLGAAKRAAERAERYGLEMLSVVADAERLPLRDRSVDLVYVHDGLHHLESPHAGLHEMLRTSRKAISVNEPAQARATNLAARVRLSAHYEEAGNFIARLDPAILALKVAAAGFEVVKNERYAMVYRHEPGRASWLLSQPGFFAPTTAGLRLFNGLAGDFGNKLTLQAVRPESDE